MQSYPAQESPSFNWHTMKTVREELTSIEQQQLEGCGGTNQQACVRTTSGVSLRHSGIYLHV